MLKVLDLFSGIGGFSLGLERTGGFETVAFCEIEPFPRAVLRKHWPDVRQYEDVRTLTADQLVRDGIGSVDVVCGGFPCQDLSYAGKGAGLEGARSGLWSEIVRLVRETKPRYVIVENVNALLGRGMGVVLRDLAALGYDAEWHCIPVAAIGGPHIRDRLWIIAYPRCELRTQPILTHDHVEEARRRGARQWRKNRVFPKMGAVCSQVLNAWMDRSKTRRVDDGILHWPYRLKAIGNAVSPQVPQLIGEAILQDLKQS